MQDKALTLVEEWQRQGRLVRVFETTPSLLFEGADFTLGFEPR